MIAAIIRFVALVGGVMLLLINLILLLAGFIPRGTQLVYVTECNQWQNIALVDLRHGLTRCLTDTNSTKAQIAISPDGNLLAYFNQGAALFSLKLIDLETDHEWGYGLDRPDFYVNVQQPFSWSIDNRTIAFVANTTSDNADIFTIDVYTGEITLLFDAGNDSNPNWSPISDHHIAISSRRDGREQTYIFNTQDNRVEEIVGESIGLLWAKNGTRLIFRRNNEQVQIQNTDGITREIRLPNNTNWTEMSVAPDGNMLVLPMQLYQNRTWLLSRVNTVSGAIMHISSQQHYIGQPQWSPDGRWIAYVSNRAGGDNIMLYHVDSGRIRQLTISSVRDWNPIWRP